MSHHPAIPLATLLLVCVAGTSASISADEPKGPSPVRVTVATILASTKKTETHEKLASLAEAIQKRDSSLIGFQLESVLQQSIPIGESHTFELIEGQKLTVIAVMAKDKNGRVGLTLKPPGLDEITYNCTCEKFFPVITPHKTKNGDVLIVAVMAKPCTGKGP